MCVFVFTQEIPEQFRYQSPKRDTDDSNSSIISFLQTPQVVAFLGHILANIESLSVLCATYEVKVRNRSFRKTHETGSTDAITFNQVHVSCSGQAQNKAPTIRMVHKHDVCHDVCSA